MGLLDQSVRDLYQDMRAIRSGDMELDKAGMLMKGYSNIAKLVNPMVTLAIHEMKFDERFERRVKRSGLYDHSALLAPTMDEAKVEPVYCEMKGYPVTRQTCLSLSGSADHFEGCSECEFFASTRSLLLADLKGKKFSSDGPVQEANEQVSQDERKA